MQDGVSVKGGGIREGERSGEGDYVTGSWDELGKSGELPE
jgi:hypothetical protein